MLTFSILSLAAIAAASPVKLSGNIQINGRDVTEADVDNFAYYAEHAGAAYCNSEVAVGTAISCGGNCPTLEANGVTVLGSFSGDATGIAGYVSVDKARGEIVFSARGSSNILNWITNLNFDLVDTDIVSGGQYHDGFSEAWSEVASGVSKTIASALSTYPGYRVVSTGHSLGGAVATIGAAAIRKAGTDVDLYTYGAPRVGNTVVSDYISAQSGSHFRITHLDDPVPRLPPIIFGYAHISPEYWLSVSESSGEDYPVSEIQVCYGNQNVDCNASTGGLDIEAHLTYFGPVSDCTRATTSDVSDEDRTELEEKVDAWAQADRDFVKNNA